MHIFVGNLALTTTEQDLETSSTHPRSSALWVMHPSALSRQPNSLPGEGATHTPIALTLEQLQPMQLTFRAAMAPLQGEAGGQRAEVFLKTAGEAGPYLNPPPRPLCSPNVPGATTALSDEAQQGRHERMRLRDTRVHLPALLQIQRGIRRPFGDRTHAGKGPRPRRRALETRVRRDLGLRSLSCCTRAPPSGHEARARPGGIGLA